MDQNTSTTQPINPNQDIDLSNIQIIDTSKGDSVDTSTIPYGDNIFSLYCEKCGYKYEGAVRLEKCPRCGSEQIRD